ncbi:hypothetical protein LCGC14_0839590 [marine sediment metagenome]|uniref:Uncharacterized protein n=1 Tax=marine sediment metagenome TaxID=412755 RepID=A0A0F9RY75_9ZZZZ
MEPRNRLQRRPLQRRLRQLLRQGNGRDSSARQVRPCNLEWVESLVNWAKAANIPIWIKQLDINGRVSHDPAEWPEWARLRELPQEMT